MQGWVGSLVPGSVGACSPPPVQAVVDAVASMAPPPHRAPQHRAGHARDPAPSTRRAGRRPSAARSRTPSRAPPSTPGRGCPARGGGADSSIRRRGLASPTGAHLVLVPRRRAPCSRRVAGGAAAARGSRPGPCGVGLRSPCGRPVRRRVALAPRAGLAVTVGRLAGGHGGSGGGRLSGGNPAMSIRPQRRGRVRVPAGPGPTRANGRTGLGHDRLVSVRRRHGG